MVSTLEQMQVPNGTGPGVLRSKRPLLASRTRCNVLWKPPKFGNKVKIGNKVKFGNKVANEEVLWRRGPPVTYLGPRPGSTPRWILPKSQYKCDGGHEYFIPTKFGKYPSSDSVVKADYVIPYI